MLLCLPLKYLCSLRLGAAIWLPETHLGYMVSENLILQHPMLKHTRPLGRRSPSMNMNNFRLNKFLGRHSAL